MRVWEYIHVRKRESRWGSLFQLVEKDKDFKFDIPLNSFAFLAACAELTRARSTSPEWISALHLVAWESQLFCSISLIAFCNLRTL
ncbi:hypothetical protein CXF70_09635 [Planomicrobium sp. MB-3u-38]|nr:hypothetical protein CXF70_09635 [Planomicrobium sp. MB-3u-38]